MLIYCERCKKFITKAGYSENYLELGICNECYRASHYERKRERLAREARERRASEKKDNSQAGS